MSGPGMIWFWKAESHPEHKYNRETAGKKNHNRFWGTKNNTVMNSVIILPLMMGLIATKTLSALKPLEMIMSYIADLPLPVASERFENFKEYY